MILTNSEVLEVLLTNMTHFVDIGAPVDAAMFYEADGASHIKLPDGKIMHGKWLLRPDGYEVAWENGPSAAWKFDYEAGQISYLDDAGKNHGPVTKIVPGDGAGLL